MAAVEIACPCGCGETHEFAFRFTYSPAERMTRDYPGAPEEIECEAEDAPFTAACGTTFAPDQDVMEEQAREEMHDAASASAYDTVAERERDDD